MNIVIVLIIVVMLLLVVAVLGLFAMMGELSAGTASSVSSEIESRPLETANVGQVLDEWPDAFRDLASGDSTLLVFSSSCAACGHVLAGESGPLPEPGEIGLVLVVPDARAASLMESKYPVISRYPHFVDFEGSWVRDQAGVESSPSFLRTSDRRLVEAAVFTSARALKTDSAEAGPAPRT